MIVIGLTGEKRGGKGSFVKILRENLPEKKIVRMGFGDIVGDMLDILGKEKSRDNMQKLPIALINGFNQPDIITQAMKVMIGNLQQENPDIVILDGIRTWEDLRMLRSFPESFLVYITASLETRYERAKAGNEKAGDNSLTLEKFKAQDNAEIEKLIPEIGKCCDYPISNERTLEDYKEDVGIFVSMFIGKAE